MVLVSAPESTVRIPFPESWMSFKHFLGTSRFQHNLSILHHVPFWNVHGEVNMIPSKSKGTKLESKLFKFTKSLNTGIDVGLLSETVISTYDVELHRDPIVPCVMCELFIASAIIIFHIFICSCCTVRGQTVMVCRVQQKKGMVYPEKKGTQLFICGSFATLQTTQYSQLQL